MKQKEEKVVLDTLENSNLSKDEIIKRYKREIANLHRAITKLKKDKELLIEENTRLIIKLERFEEIFD